MFRRVLFSLSLSPRLCCLSPWVKQMHHFFQKKKSLLPALPPIVPFPRMEVFPAIDFLPARALPNTGRFLASVISLCLPPFNSLLWLNVRLPNCQWGEEGGALALYARSKVWATDFFLMRANNKSKPFKAAESPFLITTQGSLVMLLVETRIARFLSIMSLCRALSWVLPRSG